MKGSPTNSKRRIFDIAIKDLKQIARDRTSFLFLLIMPIAFTLLFGFAFGGNSTEDPRLPIGLFDEDGSEISAHLVSMLESSDVVRIIENEATAAELEQQVSDEDVAAAIIIPAEFGSKLLAGETIPVLIIGSGQAGMTVDADVQTAVSRLISIVQTANISVETAVAHGLSATPAEEKELFDAAFSSALTEWETPPVTIHHDESSALAEEVETTTYSTFAQTSPAMMAQFAIAGLIGAAGILVIEKKTKSVQRLLTTNLSRGQILLGHFLAMFVMIFLQLSVLILFGQLFLDLPYFGQPLATLLMTIATALFTASLGMLIGAVAKTEEQVIVLSLVPMFLLAALGGAWVPMEFTPESFQQIASWTPVAFVMDGYKDILIRGQGVRDISLSLVALLIYAVVLFAIAAWRFRFD